jgi:hypothetical protein
MKESLENFIRQNKAGFDDKEPSGKVWTKISNTLFSTHSLWNSVAIWRAAAVVLLGVCVYLLIPKIGERQDRTVAMNEFKDIESFYISQISEKVDLLKGFNNSDSGLNGYTSDFQQLEAMYQVLKEEMKTRPSQKVKDALVLNLLIRIDLLNKQLHKIEKEGDENRDEDKISV